MPCSGDKGLFVVEAVFSDFNFVGVTAGRIDHFDVLHRFSVNG